MSDVIVNTDEPTGADTGSRGNSDGIVFVNPSDIGSDGTDSGTGGDTGTGRRRRGRPSGSGAKKTEDGGASLAGIDVGDVLKSIHVLLSVKIGPHWQLDDAEAKQLGNAIKKAMRHQDMKITQKQLDYAMLAYCLATVYGSRIVTSVTLAKGSKQREQQPLQGGVINFPFPQGNA